MERIGRDMDALQKKMETFIKNNGRLNEQNPKTEAEEEAEERKKWTNRLYKAGIGRFPSPHSGILFLSCRYDMPPSLNIFAIFRRILHLLAQKGFPLTQSIHFSPYPSASARIKSFFIHIVPSPIPLNQYIITSSSFISPMPHDLTLVWS